MNRKDNRILIIILPLILLVCFSVWQLKTTMPMINVESKDGVWDVRGFDFGPTAAALIGDIEYVPGELLTPEEFAASKHIVVGEIPEGTEYLTSRVRILASENRNQYEYAKQNNADEKDAEERRLNRCCLNEVR